MPLVIRGSAVPGTTMQVLQAANTAYPSLAFAQSQNTGLFLSAPATLGVSAGGVESLTVSNASTTITANAAPRLVVTSNAVSMNLAFVSNQTPPTRPFVGTATYDLSVPQLTANNSQPVSVWGSATGYAYGTGTLPIFKTFSGEPVDKYVSFAGNVGNGSYFTFGTTTWKVASNQGFSCLAHVRTSSSSIGNNERIFDFGSGTDSFWFGRNRTSGNVIFYANASPEAFVSTTTPVLSGGWQVLGCRLALASNVVGTQTWGMTIFNNGANVASSSFTSTISDKNATQSYIGRPWNVSARFVSADSFSTMDIRSVTFYDYPLTDTDFANLYAYEYARFNTLSSTANAAQGSVLVSSSGGAMYVSASGDISGVRSIDGMPLQRMRHWSPQNLLKNDILGILQASRDACPVSSTIDAVRDIGNFPGSYAFFGSVLMQDRRVFIVPHNSTSARIYDPMTNVVTTPGGSYAGSNSYAGGVLLPDGRVLCIPYNVLFGKGAIYTPWTDSVTATTTMADFRPPSFAGGVLVNDGRVFLIPYNTYYPSVYDPAVDSMTTVSLSNLNPSGFIGFTLSGVAKYAGGVLLQDGRVYCVPHNATYPLLFDPVSNAVSFSTASFPAEGAYWGGVLLPDGRVFNVPHNATSARIYDPVTDTVSLVPGFPGNYAFLGGCLLPCGRVLCIPYSVPYCVIYDPIRDVITVSSGTFSASNGYAGAVLLPDGRAFVSPCNDTTAKLLNTSWGSVPIPVSVLTSPYLNTL